MVISEGIVFNIERYTIHDGPGIRTTVFLKGCPLRCLWCSNPESQIQKPQLAFFSDKCIKCHRCLKTCPQDALSVKKDNTISVDFQKCTGCGQCTEVCYPEALVMIGKRMTAEEVIDEVVRDLPFYKRSGGGVTLSGGDPLHQIEFSREILRLCKEKKIHTAIQTSGYTGKKQFDSLLPFLDLIIFDIKHLDPYKHKEYTGVNNKQIIANLKYLAAKKCNLVVQMPLIPGYNDSEEHLKRVFSLVKKLKDIRGINLLEYHTLGVPKYKRIGRNYSLPDIEIPKNYLEKKKEFTRQCGINLVAFN